MYEEKDAAIGLFLIDWGRELVKLDRDGKVGKELKWEKKRGLIPRALWVSRLSC